jgi:hypothetical protein
MARTELPALPSLAAEGIQHHWAIGRYLFRNLFNFCRKAPKSTLDGEAATAFSTTCRYGIVS